MSWVDSFQYKQTCHSYVIYIPSSDIKMDIIDWKNLKDSEENVSLILKQLLGKLSLM